MTAVAIYADDTGPGIPADRHAAIFELFVQLGDPHGPQNPLATARRPGLAISRDLAVGRAFRGEHGRAGSTSTAAAASPAKAPPSRRAPADAPTRLRNSRQGRRRTGWCAASSTALANTLSFATDWEVHDAGLPSRDVTLRASTFRSLRAHVVQPLMGRARRRDVEPMRLLLLGEADPCIAGCSSSAMTAALVRIVAKGVYLAKHCDLISGSHE